MAQTLCGLDKLKEIEWDRAFFNGMRLLNEGD